MTVQMYSTATKFLRGQLMNNSVRVCVCLMMNSQQCVTLTTEECIITSCRCSRCFSRSVEWSCCRSFSSSCICHSLSRTVCFSISWSNAVSSRCTGSWGSLDTHTLRSGLLVSLLSPSIKTLFSIYPLFSSTLVYLCLFGSSCLYTPHESILTFSWCCVWDFSPSDCVSSGCQIESDYSDSSVPYSDSTPANIYR